MPQKAIAIAFRRSQIFTTEPASPKIGCTPEGSETTDDAQKCFSHALHFVERYLFVGINRPFDIDASCKASTIYMTPFRSLNKNFSSENTFQSGWPTPCQARWLAQRMTKSFREKFPLQNVGFYKMAYVYMCELGQNILEWVVYIYISLYKMALGYLIILFYNMAGFIYKKYRSITFRGVWGGLL